MTVPVGIAVATACVCAVGYLSMLWRARRLGGPLMTKYVTRLGERPAAAHSTSSHATAMPPTTVFVQHADQVNTNGGQGAYWRGAVTAEELAAHAAAVVNIRPAKPIKTLEGPR